MADHRQETIDNTLNRLLCDLDGASPNEYPLAPEPLSLIKLGKAASVAEHIAKRTNLWAARFRRQMNAVLPVYRIPPELLSSIFHYTVDPDATDTRNSTYYAHLRLLRLVCVYWAELIDGFPSLWTHTAQDLPQPILDMALRKSQGMPVSVIYAEPDSRVPVNMHGPYLVQIPPRLYQWGKLSVKTSQKIVLKNFMEAPAPSLEYLKLTALGEATDSPMDDYFIPFVKAAPRLRHVDLRQCYFKWDIPLLSGLHTLMLSNLHHSSPTTLDLIRILLSCPRLSTLEISGGYMNVSPMDSSWDGIHLPIYLPNLLRGTLVGVDRRTQVTSELLNLMEFPPNAQMTLDVQNGTANPPAAQLEAVGKWIESTSPRWVCPETVRIDILNIFSLRRLTVAYGGQHISLRLFHRMYKDCRILLAFIDRKRRALTNAATLVYDYQRRETAREYSELIGEFFPAIARFTLDGDGALMAIPALLPPTTSSEVQSFRWLFPALDHLTIEERSPVVDEAHAQMLLEIARTRLSASKSRFKSKSGGVVPITTIIIATMSASQATYNQMRDLVPNLNVKTFTPIDV